MTNNLLAKHPDLRDILYFNPGLNLYRVFTTSGKTAECWEKNTSGEWTDVTAREQLREQIEAEKEELERLRKLEQRAKETK